MQHLEIPNGEEYIFADPENALYDDLDLNRGVATTFLSPATPVAIRDRLLSGDTKELGEVLQKWSKAVYIPPKREQAFNQGGTFIFRGNDTLYAHYDEATGAHADINYVIKFAIDSAAPILSSR